MINKLTFSVALALLAVVGAVEGQGPSENQVRIERAQAEREVPQLAGVLELKPGMTVADVGAGGGAITVVLGKWIGSGRVFATDIGAQQLQLIRDYVMREGLSNVTVIEGRATSTNLPDACCDAIFLRDVYHHLSDPESMNKSLRASLKPGGRLAVMDFAPEQGSKTPAGVPANREGHGIGSPMVISEVSAAGLTHSNTIEKWPPGDEKSPIFLVLFRKP